MHVCRRLCLLAILLAGVALAGPIFVIDTGSIPNSVTANLFFSSSSGTTTFDVRGRAQLDVFNPGFLGALFLVDPIGGATDLANPPFGNNLMYLTNATPQTAAVFVSFASPQFSNGGLNMDLPALSVSANPIPVTDPEVVAALGILKFSFGFLSSTQVGNDTLSVYQLDSVSAVPEPGSFSLIASALALVGLGLRRKAKG